MITGIHHLAINTSDIDRLIAFYCEIVGMTLVRRGHFLKQAVVDKVIGLEGAMARNAMLSTGNCFVELFEYSSPEPRAGKPLRPCDRGYTHLCLDVVDIRSEYARLCDRGMHFNSPPEDFGALWSAYGFDPDGNIVEIQEVTDPDHVFAMGRLRGTDNKPVSGN